MTRYFQIADWDKHYEVDQDGRAWKPGKPFRQGPLEYVRAKARGRDWSRSCLALSDMAGENMYWAIGVFQKIIDIVAGEPRSLREGGIIRNRKDEPATLEEIAWMLRVKVSTLEEAFRLLTHPEVGWIEAVGQESSQEPAAACDLLREAEEVREVPRESADRRGQSRESADLAENRFMSCHVKSEQNKSCHSHKTPCAQKAPKSQADTEALAADFDWRSLSGHDMTRLRLRVLYHLRQTLRPPDERGHIALSNFEEWLYNHVVSGRAGPDLTLYRQAVDIAQDCINGRSPLAVFLSRVQQQLGYVPPSRQARVMMSAAQEAG